MTTVDQGSPSDLVAVSDVDGVRVLTFNNPSRRNGWSHAMEAEYFAALQSADLDPTVKVVVVTGSGDAFCPGLDIDKLEDTATQGTIEFSSRVPQNYATKVRKPVIAAINGICAGIGLGQALYCDLRFASRTARFSTAYSRRGLAAEYGISWLLPRLVGVERALDLLLSGRVFNAEEAHTIGLVSYVTEHELLLPTVLRYAQDIAVNCSPRSMAAIKRQVYDDLSRRFDESIIATLSLMRTFVAGTDFSEGARAFKERRPPAFNTLDTVFRIDSELGY